MDNDDVPNNSKAHAHSGGADDDDEFYASSSCSISIESDCEVSRGHQITVPVTIEPPPPEMRTACANNNNSSSGGGHSHSSNPRREHHHHTRRSHDEAPPSQPHKPCQIHPSPKSGKPAAQDSTEEIKRASPGGAAAVSAPEVSRPPPETEVDAPSTEAGGMRMVLVRDIGVQVSGDSPNLNLQRRTHKRQQQQQPPPQRQDSLAEKFPAEILF
jgi:hypothetical protein